MKLIYNNSQEYINKLTQFVNFLAAFPMLIFIFLFIKIENNDYHPGLLNENTQFFLGILTFVLVSGIISLAILRFTSELKKIRNMDDLRSRLDKYYSAVRNRSYLYEIATIVALAGMALSGEGIYALYYSMALVAFSIGYPTVIKIASQLKLKGEEREIIMKKQDIPW